MCDIHAQYIHRCLNFSSFIKLPVNQVQSISSFVYSNSPFNDVSVTTVLIGLLFVRFHLRCFWSPKPWARQADAILLTETYVFTVPVRLIRKYRFGIHPMPLPELLRTLYESIALREVVPALGFYESKPVNYADVQK